MSRRSLAALAALGLAAACGDKSAAPAFTSGPLTPDELALLARVPPGDAVFGGDVFTALHWAAASPLARLAPALTDPTTAAWLGCLAELHRPTAGTATARDGRVTVHLYTRPLTLDTLDNCSTGPAADPDRRFLEATVGPVFAVPALAVDDGVLMRIDLPLAAFRGQHQAVAPATRADLEASLAALATASAATDPRFAPTLAGLDRRRTVWFAGDGDRTDLAHHLGPVHGTADTSRGLRLDASATLRPPGTAADLVGRFHSARDKLDMVPVGLADLKRLAHAVTLRRTSDTLHLSTALTDDMLADAARLAAPLLRRF